MEKDFQKARDMLIVHNLRLVVYIAKKFENTGIWLEDLVSIGTVGLIKAVNTFSVNKNIKLATYASRCIENEILMYLRKYSQYRYDISIDEPLNVDWDGNELLLSDVLGTDDDCVNSRIEDEVEKQLLHEAVDRLAPREKRIMEMRFGLNGCSEKTQKEVADEIGISQSYISRLEKRILKQLNEISLKEAIRGLGKREKRILNLRFFRGKTQVEVAKEIGISQAQVSRLEKGALNKIKNRI